MSCRSFANKYKTSELKYLILDIFHRCRPSAISGSKCPQNATFLNPEEQQCIGNPSAHEALQLPAPVLSNSSEECSVKIQSIPISGYEGYQRQNQRYKLGNDCSASVLDKRQIASISMFLMKTHLCLYTPIMQHTSSNLLKNKKTHTENARDTSL